MASERIKFPWLIPISIVPTSMETLVLLRTTGLLVATRNHLAAGDSVMLLINIDD